MTATYPLMAISMRAAVNSSQKKEEVSCRTEWLGRAADKA